jgi:hypothetical protein
MNVHDDSRLAVTWSQFHAAAAVLGDFGKKRLQGRIAYLATIRLDGSPRVHPVSPFITNDHLFVYMEPTSPKVLDLRRDARYSIHCAVEDNAGGQGEFVVRGDAVEIRDTGARELAFEQARAMGYRPQARYILFELRVADAVATQYENGQPRRVRWKAQ